MQNLFCCLWCGNVVFRRESIVEVYGDEGNPMECAFLVRADMVRNLILDFGHGTYCQSCYRLLGVRSDEERLYLAWVIRLDLRFQRFLNGNCFGFVVFF